ncbi:MULTISPECIES: PolC-type DNA polymerase III [Micromonospora]|uniref:3'-5' exonuclease n=1 Tax=Micromonospora TaxID=1873 RepID=UPI00064C32D1|nr:MULTISPECIES: 3'-5' exonuclease [unclassified Micromonospora]MDG4756182.1 3'-5' exonuclease [Micromonospora sp. WMMD718]
MGALTTDPEFLATTFVVIDFEATTPTGYPAQPVEVAALALRYTGGEWASAGRSTSLIRPPAFAPVTPALTIQTGLTAEQLELAPSPAEALGALDRRFTAGKRYLLVAQHAATEANLIYNQREHCPTLARTDLLDTIPLAKHLIPGLLNYKLDTLLAHFSLTHPADRHRAYADVDITAQVFTRLINAADVNAQLNGLADLVKIAGRTAKSNVPIQSELFPIEPAEQPGVKGQDSW